MASSSFSSSADDRSRGLLSGVWNRLRAAAPGWSQKGGNEGEEAIVSSPLARRRFGRMLAFISFNLELLIFVYAFWRARRRSLNWRQPIQALPMLVVPALATLIYTVFRRFAKTFDHKDTKLIQRFQKDEQVNECVLREFEHDEQNNAKKYDWTDDPSNFSDGVDLAETSKHGASPQTGINSRDNGGDIAWDHSKDFWPKQSDGLEWKKSSIKETCMSSSNAVIQPICCVSEHLADDAEHLDDVAETNMAYSTAETDTYLLECSPLMNNPKYNGGVAEENSAQIALTGPMSDYPAFAEFLDEGNQENKSSKFHVSEENKIFSISETEIVGSYAVKHTEQRLGTTGFSLCSQDNEKEDASGGVCFVRVSPDLTSPELVVEGSKYFNKKESYELNTNDVNDVVVNSEEAFVVSNDERYSGDTGFFFHAQGSNVIETSALVNIVTIRPEPNYPPPVESLTHAPDDVDFKGDETSNVHLLEQKGQDVFLGPLMVDFYEDSFTTSKILFHGNAAKNTEVPGEDLSQSLDKGASSHQNDVPISSDYSDDTDNSSCDSMSVKFMIASNIIEAFQGGEETLSDPVSHSGSHSAGIFLSSTKVNNNNDEASSSNSHSYFLYANSMEVETHLAGHIGCSESKGEMDISPILLNEVTSGERFTDNNSGRSQYIQENVSTESLHSGNQVQTKTSEKVNFGLEESLISSEEGMKSGIFSLYSRSSSCVSDVNMVETLDVAFPD